MTSLSRSSSQLSSNNSPLQSTIRLPQKISIEKLHQQIDNELSPYCFNPRNGLGGNFGSTRIYDANFPTLEKWRQLQSSNSSSQLQNIQSIISPTSPPSTETSSSTTTPTHQICIKVISKYDCLKRNGVHPEKRQLPQQLVHKAQKILQTIDREINISTILHLAPLPLTDIQHIIHQALLVHVYSRSNNSDYALLCMDYIPNVHLTSSFLLPKGKMILPTFCIETILMQLLLVIRLIHENNICHRDIKPDNILLIKNTSFWTENLDAFRKQFPQIPIHENTTLHEYISLCKQIQEQMKKEKEFREKNNIQNELAITKPSLAQRSGEYLNIENLPVIKLIDFGFARVTAKSTDLTTSVLGTPLFQPPEQLLARETSPQQNDFYAASITILSFLFGFIPHYQSSSRDMLSHERSLATIDSMVENYRRTKQLQARHNPHGSFLRSFSPPFLDVLKLLLSGKNPYQSTWFTLYEQIITQRLELYVKQQPVFVFPKTSSGPVPPQAQPVAALNHANIGLLRSQSQLQPQLTQQHTSKTSKNLEQPEKESCNEIQLQRPEQTQIQQEQQERPVQQQDEELSTQQQVQEQGKGQDQEQMLSVQQPEQELSTQQQQQEQEQKQDNQDQELLLQQELEQKPSAQQQRQDISSTQQKQEQEQDLPISEEKKSQYTQTPEISLQSQSQSQTLQPQSYQSLLQPDHIDYDELNRLCLQIDLEEYNPTTHFAVYSQWSCFGESFDSTKSLAIIALNMFHKIMWYSRRLDDSFSWIQSPAIQPDTIPFDYVVKLINDRFRTQPLISNGHVSKKLQGGNNNTANATLLPQSLTYHYTHVYKYNAESSTDTTAAPYTVLSSDIVHIIGLVDDVSTYADFVKRTQIRVLNLFMLASCAIVLLYHHSILFNHILPKHLDDELSKFKECLMYLKSKAPKSMNLCNNDEQFQLLKCATEYIEIYKKLIKRIKKLKTICEKCANSINNIFTSLCQVYSTSIEVFTNAFEHIFIKNMIDRHSIELKSTPLNTSETSTTDTTTTTTTTDESSTTATTTTVVANTEISKQPKIMLTNVFMAFQGHVYRVVSYKSPHEFFQFVRIPTFDIILSKSVYNTILSPYANNITYPELPEESQQSPTVGLVVSSQNIDVSSSQPAVDTLLELFGIKLTITPISCPLIDETNTNNNKKNRDIHDSYLSNFSIGLLQPSFDNTFLHDVYDKAAPFFKHSFPTKTPTTEQKKSDSNINNDNNDSTNDDNNNEDHSNDSNSEEKPIENVPDTTSTVPKATVTATATTTTTTDDIPTSTEAPTSTEPSMALVPSYVSPIIPLSALSSHSSYLIFGQHIYPVYDDSPTPLLPLSKISWLAYPAEFSMTTFGGRVCSTSVSAALTSALERIRDVLKRKMEDNKNDSENKEKEQKAFDKWSKYLENAKFFNLGPNQVTINTNYDVNEAIGVDNNNEKLRNEDENM